jgi:hypothetical protein
MSLSMLKARLEEGEGKGGWWLVDIVGVIGLGR